MVLIGREAATEAHKREFISKSWLFGGCLYQGSTAYTSEAEIWHGFTLACQVRGVIGEYSHPASFAVAQ